MRRRTTWMAVATCVVFVPAAAPDQPRPAGLSLAVGAPPAHVLPSVAPASRPTLSLGARGSAVSALQERLRAQRATVAVDGRFGAATLRAVLAFQAARGLPADGIVGPRTWQVLDGSAPTLVSSSARPNLRLGTSGAAVAEAQRLLTRAGHRTAADGRFGPSTQGAVLGFQRARRLTADGVIGRATWTALSPTAAPALQLISSITPGPWRTFGARPYVVRRGDTLASVAAATRSTATALATVNRLPAGSRPTVGSTLLVPGGWRCPVPGGGFINDYGFVRAAGRTHEGNDLFAIRGTPVVAPVRGRLERRDGGLGGHAVNLYGEDGNRYYFAHLDRYGATGRVNAGTVIGYVGNTGNAITTPPHLHFEIHPGGSAGSVNPYPTLTLACRR